MFSTQSSSKARLKNDTLGNDALSRLYGCYESSLPFGQFKQVCEDMVQMGGGKQARKDEIISAIRQTASSEVALKKVQDLQQEISEEKSTKLIPKGCLIVDINAIPIEHGINADEWAKLIREQGVCLYDSRRGNTPFLTDEDSKIILKDINQLELIFEENGTKEEN